MSTFWGGGVLRAESSLRVHGHLCVLLLGHQGGQLSALTSLHFSVVCGLQGWRGEVVCVLGGVQVHTPASWGTGSANRGRMGPCGVAANEGLWSWSDGPAGLVS